MQNDVGEYELGERFLPAQVHELGLVLLIHLNSERGAQHERGDRRYEAGQERIEWECTDEQTVGELDDAGQQNVEQVGIDDLQIARCSRQVIPVEFVDDIRQFSHFDLRFESTFFAKAAASLQIVMLFRRAELCAQLRKRQQ